METNENNVLEPRFWQGRVKITQIPSEIEEQVVFNTSTQKTVEIEKSWLYDSFFDKTVYGLEITLNQSFSWIFYLNAASEAEAIRKGFSYLMVLEERFPGLTGNVEAVPITSSILSQNSPLYELVLPKQPYNGREEWSLLKKIIQLYRKNEHNLIQFYIFWQRDDSIFIRKSAESSRVELYKTKMFFRINRNNKLNLKNVNSEASKLYGQVDYLITGIRNQNGERAFIRKTSLNNWENILASDVFWVNKDDIHTHYCYYDVSHQIPEERLPTFISPDKVDFSFLKDLPISKANKLPYENINYIQNGAEKKGISLGTIVTNGVLTKNVKNLPVNHFAHNVFIAGLPGAGKTYFLGHILKEFYEKTKDIGVLILNLGKGRQEGFFLADRYLKYGSPEFHLSYFYEGEYLDRALQETASYLIASLGLGSPCDKILYNVMKAFIRVNGELPSSLGELFKGLKKWFKDYPYDKKYQTRILRALKNRIPTILSEQILDRTLALSSSLDVPSWFQEWNKGKTVFIDLCMCNIYVKRLLTSAIFQMVRILTPDIEVGKLQNIIAIDEAHQILEKPITNNPDHDEFISKEHLEIIFNNLIREFRSKGLSFILVDNAPHLLFNCATALPSLKILFGLDHLDINAFTGNLKIQDYLILQEPRNALIMNGNNQEFFVVRTPDYYYSLK
ncbi:MAG: hypothetical protein ACFFBC_03790 [Promethearchaeota archaeon]